MKAWEAQKTFEQLQRDLRAKELKRMYLLYGDERYLCQFYFKRLLGLLGGEIGDMNTNVFEGKAATIGAIIDQAETMPFLAENRVIVLKDTGLVKAGSDELAEYLENPCETTVFLFWESEVTENCKLFKTLQKHGSVVCIPAQNRDYLKKNIGALLQKEGKRISTETAEHMLDKTGTDMAMLRSELDKLVCYCWDKEVITTEDVDAICSQTIEDRIFQMIDSITMGNLKTTLDLYYDLLARKEAPIKILVLLEKRYLNLMQVKDLREQGEVAETIKKKLTRFPDFQIQQFIRQAGKLTGDQIRHALELCADIDERIKTGRISDTIGVEMMIIQLATRT